MFCVTQKGRRRYARLCLPWPTVAAHARKELRPVERNNTFTTNPPTAYLPKLFENLDALRHLFSCKHQPGFLATKRSEPGCLILHKVDVIAPLRTLSV